MKKDNSKKLLRVVLKEEMVAVTGNAISAIVLNQMVYWTEILNKSDEEIRKEITEYQKLGLAHKVEKLEKQLRNGWFWKTAQELSEELMGVSSRATIDRKLKELVDANFLEKKKNENNKMDKKNHFRVDLDFLRNELKKHGYTLEGYAIPEDANDKSEEKGEEIPQPPIAQNEQSNAYNEQSNAQNEQSNAHSEQTYTEITTEITSETTYRESIYLEKIKNLELPSLTKRVLIDSIDRLILFNIKVLEVEILFNNTELDDKAFSSVLYSVLHSEINKSFKGKMEVSIQTYITNANKKPSLEPKNRKHIRNEIVPDYLKEELVAGEQEAAVTNEDLDDQKKALQDKWKAWKAKEGVE